MEGAIGLKVVVVIGKVGIIMQDWCPRDQLQVNGGICRVRLPKGGVIIREGWVEYVLNDIGKEYANYPPPTWVKIVLVLLRALVAEARSRVTGS